MHLSILIGDYQIVGERFGFTRTLARRPATSYRFGGRGSCSRIGLFLLIVATFPDTTNIIVANLAIMSSDLCLKLDSYSLLIYVYISLLCNPAH